MNELLIFELAYFPMIAFIRMISLKLTLTIMKCVRTENKYPNFISTEAKCTVCFRFFFPTCYLHYGTKQYSQQVMDILCPLIYICSTPSHSDL